MITTRYVRENIDAIRKSLEKRKSDYPIDELLELDKAWRDSKTKLQELQSKRNKLSLEIAELKKKGMNDEAAEKAKEAAQIKEDIDKLSAETSKNEARIDYLLLNLPNVLHETVPYGKDSSENIEIKKWGEPVRRSIKGHDEILKGLGLLDTEQAAEVSGARFYYLKGDLALLEHALMHFAIDEMVKKGYELIEPPLLMKKQYYKGVTALGDFEEMLYRVGEPLESKGTDMEHVDEDLFLIATSEHPIAAMHANHVFSAKDLPKKYVGYSPCFRREAGAHGKDTKGIFRTHQFYKVEQFIFSKQEDSWKYHEELLHNEEELFQKLGIPYRVVNICTGDLGVVAAKKYDIEAYMPAQNEYREVTSCSNCTDWQSLRLDIKYDEGNERKYVHTLNATAIAANRAMVAIIENYALDNGKVKVPDALVPYIGKDIIG
ncbi:MAG: serine--tRNA ligase [Candidatus Micrarchaeia archaeon]